jgi:hypothetical protein
MRSETLHNRKISNVGFGACTTGEQTFLLAADTVFTAADMAPLG